MRFILAALILAVSCAKAPAPPASSGPLTLETVSTADVLNRLTAAQGKVVFFHVYASWCGPCAEEFPDVIELARAYPNQGLEIIAVSMDEAPEDVTRFLKSQPPFPALFLNPAMQKEFSTALGSKGLDFRGGIPYTAVFGRNGRLMDQWTGSKDLEKFEKVIQPLL